ncbi:MAG: PQQ-binding-like beta-propeller repeat protein, partial [Candidatus Poribacteria bacterium]
VLKDNNVQKVKNHYLHLLTRKTDDINDIIRKGTMEKFFRLVRTLAQLEMLLLSCICSLIVVVSANSAVSDKPNDWPGWRGRNTDGIAYQKGIFRPGINYDLKVAWNKPLGSGISSVSIADDLAITMFSDHTFDYMAAFDVQNGEELWRKKIDTTYKGHSNSQDGPISTPLISEGVVYGLGPKGHLFAINAKTGLEIWSTHLVNEYGAKLPDFGFGTSPVIYRDVLILQTGGANSVTGFDRNTGKRLWTAGTDSINYQSPIIVTMNGKDQVLCAGDHYIYAIEPLSGEKIWEYNHKGGGWRGSMTMSPVLVDNNKILLDYKDSEAILIEPKELDGKTIPEVLWTNRNFAGSYAVPVYFDGYIYGYSSQFLTCVDAKTGNKVWKSRQPGEGFLILVDGHLVITTIKGSLHIAKAIPEGYQEIASLKLFDDLFWCLPSFSNGRIYSRSYSEIACVGINEVSRLALPETEGDIVAPDSEFQRFVQKVKTAKDKKTLIDTFMAQVKQFPLIEGDNLVHFIYRGDAEDMGIAGDLPGRLDEIAMHRIPDTDLYYYSSYMEPDARLNYQFVRNLDEKITDPLNPRKISFTGGDEYDNEESSWFSMPSWTAPEHLKEHEGTERGRIETHQLESKISGGIRQFDIYLPSGYDKGEKRYPVAYIHLGKLAQAWGKIPNTLDNLIGKR